MKAITKTNFSATIRSMEVGDVVAFKLPDVNECSLRVMVYTIAKQRGLKYTFRKEGLNLIVACNDRN